MRGGARHDARMFSRSTIRFLCATLALVCTHLSAAERPNVLIILADDLGYSDLGCYGGDIATPTLDRLAANGVRFTQFYNTARCWPTRTAIMTGYYPQQVGMDPPVKGPFPAWTQTLPQMLKPLGYRSYHSGKWHIARAPRPCADAGFDLSYHIADQDRHFGPRKHEENDVPLPAVKSESGYYSTIAVADHAIRCLRDHAATPWRSKPTSSEWIERGLSA